MSYTPTAHNMPRLQEILVAVIPLLVIGVFAGAVCAIAGPRWRPWGPIAGLICTLAALVFFCVEFFSIPNYSEAGIKSDSLTVVLKSTGNMFAVEEARERALIESWELCGALGGVMALLSLAIRLNHKPAPPR
jgi:hypothetical protein